MFRLSILLAFTALFLTADPLTCTSGTLNSYLALGSDGCRLGTRVLSGFELTPASTGATEINPNAVLVTPSASGATGSLLFSYSIGALAGAILESDFQMTVVPDLGAPQIVGLQLIGATATGDGVVAGVADLCSGILISGVCTGTSTPLIVLVSSSDNLSSSSTITGGGSFDLQQTIVADAGLTGTALLSSAQLTFTDVPEPASLGIVAAALAATFTFRRRLRSRSSQTS